MNTKIVIECFYCERNMVDHFNKQEQMDTKRCPNCKHEVMIHHG